MSYSHVLVAVAVTPESHRLIARAVSIVKPVNGKITLITIATDPELFNQMSAPMLENLRDVMYEETQTFLEALKTAAGYPIEKALIATGELGEYIHDICEKNDIDLVICGNHNQSFFSKAVCSAKSVLAASRTDLLLVALD
ncbi:universal stress protein UspC [Cronobacter dublinensis]|uniref:Universal stress protein n=1 Tax=Cronobacter dublinensis 1210 TaxID=1208656 RepID=A0ABP1W937_9ENTR|nr:universal stress protein UspC [Cronobacter dublinensis]CCJ81078.1 Universal stress protein C [Cronobacter dublinensis 1210]CCJ84023.1 Universal stress protein C [Cronobacter dublinensis 582]ALB67258.1 universal stress protein UspC [Cronobacter dublinensis subsp. dublinensis LMG 23823]EGT4378363.1 universal stress protein UspC [Cronobacter dublinensis]EKF2279933.1 universal stress protein UspC [Cronobacter dublinensis]